MLFGYWQKLLRVDLDTVNCAAEPISEQDLRDYIGGAGLGAAYLWRETRAGVDPLSGANRLYFATGPFQGTGYPGSAKFSVVGISPLTGTYADSAAGMSFGASLKATGYDMLALQGRAKSPVYLVIDDGRAELRDASALWGLDSFATTDQLLAEYKGAAIAAIGPAGEHRVALACIVFDKHSFAGRCGLGAVMGAMNIKAIVARGTQKAAVAQPERLAEAVKSTRKTAAANASNNGSRCFGTSGFNSDSILDSNAPIKNWTTDEWPEGAENLAPERITELLNAKSHPCKFCPVGCHRDVVITEPPQYSVTGPGPEYETYMLMGSNAYIDDAKVIAKANDMANRLGVDTISMGAVVGFCMEAWEKGLLSAKDTDGIVCTWGNPDALLRITDAVGRCKGFGARFAGGTLAAARAMGPEAVELVAHAKGLDFPGHDPRTMHSLALTYAVCTRGACHCRPGWVSNLAEIGFPADYSEDGDIQKMGKHVAVSMNYAGLINSFVLCNFMEGNGGLSFADFCAAFQFITGRDVSPQELVAAGERGVVLERLINVRDGRGAATDTLPKKFFTPAKTGKRAGVVPPLRELVAAFYQGAGWDTLGRPLPETLARLGLSREMRLSEAAL